MSERNGWIKLYNQTLDSEFWDTDEPFDYQHAFIHVLLSANWKTGVSQRNGHIITVKRGQWLTSIRKLGSRFHWDKHRVYKWLEYMTAAGMITSESVGFGTLLTIVNYDKFQGDTDTPTHTPTHEDTHAPTHTVTDTPTHEDTHEVAPRSKTIDIRTKTEDRSSSIFTTPGPEARGGDVGAVDQDPALVLPELRTYVDPETGQKKRLAKYEKIDLVNGQVIDMRADPKTGRIPASYDHSLEDDIDFDEWMTPEEAYQIWLKYMNSSQTMHGAS